MINMSVIMVAIGMCVGLGICSVIYRWSYSPEKWYGNPWGKNFLAICIGVVSIIVVDSLTPRSTFFPRASTVVEICQDLLTTFYVVAVFCFLLIWLNRLYSYCAPVGTEKWRLWPIVSKVLIGEEMIFSILLTIIIVEGNQTAAFLEIMGATTEPVQRITNITITCMLWMLLLREYVNIGEVYAISHFHCCRTIKALT